MRAAKFPVFARSFSIRGAGKRRRGVLRQPISCGGVLVWPGDIVVADDSGVAVIPAGGILEGLPPGPPRPEKRGNIMKGPPHKPNHPRFLGARGGVCEGLAPCVP